MQPSLWNALAASNTSLAIRAADAVRSRLATPASARWPAQPQGPGPDTEGRMELSADISGLLRLREDTADSTGAFDDTASPAAATVPRRAVRTATIDSNLPLHDVRFTKMTTLELLEELAQLVAGFGPEDAVPALNPGTPIWVRRGGDMRHALALTPGRQQDEVTLLAAIRQLSVMFGAHDRLVREIRQRRPDLEPVLRDWSTSLLQPSLVAALEAPFDADGSPSFVPALYDRINEPSFHAYDYYVPQLEQRMVQTHQQIFADKLTAFFRLLSTPLEPGAQTRNGVLGAAANHANGPDVRRLLTGKIVFRCSEAELAGHLQMVPAGRTTASAFFPSKTARAHQSKPRYRVAYPPRGSGTTIDQVRWEDLQGNGKTVLVANRGGVHSFSTDEGAHWKPTGGLSSLAMDDIRADGWRAFLAGRWHVHKERILTGYSGGPGR